MPAVAALLDARAPLATLRRALAPGPARVVACRSPGGLLRAYTTRLLDAVVIGVRATRAIDLAVLRERYPSIPVLAYGAVRPAECAALHALLEGPVAAVAVEGVDDAVVGDLVRRHALSRERERALADAPRLLRLGDRVQLDTWQWLVGVAGPPVSTAEAAARLGMSREHLSRQFGAGGAPNLKRVIDLLRVATAAQLLASPGYDPRAVTALLGFASPSHLGAMARRISGSPASRLGALGPRGVLAAFLRTGTRSRSR